MGGAYYGSGNIGSLPTYVKAIQTDISGAVYVTASGSLPVTFGALPQLQISNFPATQNVSGTVAITTTGPIQVWSEGATGVTGSVALTNWPATIGVSGSVAITNQVGVYNFSATQNVSGTVTVGGYSVGVTGSTYITSTGSLPVAVVGTVPVSIAGTVNTSQQGQIQVSNFPATQAVSGTVALSNWPAVIGVSGSQLTGSTFAGSPVVAGGVYFGSGNIGSLPVYVKAIETDISGAVYITSTGSLPVAVVGTVPVSLASQVQVSNFPATQNVSGTVTVTTTGPLQVWSEGAVGVTGSVALSNWPATIGISGSAPLQVWSEGNVGVSGSVSVLGQIGVYNFPATQNVSGSITVGGYGVGITGSTYITSTGSLPVAVVGTVPVSIAGTVNTSQQGQIQVSNFPATQNVSGTVTVTTTGPLQVWSEGAVGVTGSVALTNWPATVGVSGSVSVTNQVGVYNFPATQNVTGSVALSNWPATLGISGSQLTGSTFAGSPVVAGGVYFGSGNIGSLPVYVKALQTDISGAQYITTTGSLPVAVVGTVPVSLASQVQVSNFPATQNVSGTVTVTTTGPLQVWSEGAVGVTGSVALTNWPATVGVSGSVSVLGQVGVYNFPATQNVSGTVTVGGYSVGVTGSTHITSTGSLLVAVVGTVPVSIAGTVNTSQQGQVGVYNFPATQNVSGSITLGAWAANVTGSTTVTVSGSTGLMVAAPQNAPVWMTGSVALNPVPTINASTSTTGTLGLAVGNAPYAPLYVTASVGSPFWVTGTITVNNPSGGGAGGAVTQGTTPWLVAQEGMVGVSGSVALTNWPLTINVSSSAGLTGSFGINQYYGVPPLTTPVAQSIPSNQLNVTPWTLSLTGSLSASNGQALPLKSDYQGNLASREQYAPVAEDNFNGVIATAPLPLAVSYYSPTFTGSVGSLPGQIKTAPGTLYRVFATNRNGQVRYLTLHNTSSGGPSGVPIAAYPIPSLGTYVLDYAPWGNFFSVGVIVGISTSNTTYTAATPADHDFSVLYR